MTRIKNFRIPIRPREVARWLKKERGIEPSPAVESSIEQSLLELKEVLEPATLFTTLTRDTLGKTTPLKLPAKAVAASMIAISLGSKFSARREEIKLAAEENGFQEALWGAFEAEAFSQAFSFALRLLSEQAKEEECEISALTPAESAEQWVPLAALLSVSRIGIEFDAQQPQMPPFARISWVSWNPLRREKRSAPAAAAPASEKAVA